MQHQGLVGALLSTLLELDELFERTLLQYPRACSVFRIYQGYQLIFHSRHCTRKSAFTDQRLLTDRHLHRFSLQCLPHLQEGSDKLGRKAHAPVFLDKHIAQLRPTQTLLGVNVDADAVPLVHAADADDLARLSPAHGTVERFDVVFGRKEAG